VSRKTGAQAAKAALYLALSLAFCAPLFDEPLALAGRDWDQHLFFYGQVLKNVIEYGQAPFWSPWYCGGNVMWQNPQVALLSPVFPLAVFVPLQLAMKLNIALHYWVGFMGMHLLITRVIGLSFLPLVVFLGTLFTASGAMSLHLFEGHTVFLPLMYLPFVLYWLIRALQTGRIRDALLAGGVTALVVWNGGVHVLPLALVPLGTLIVVAAATARRWRPLILGGVYLMATLSYAAPKLLPVALFVTGDSLLDKRSVEGIDRVTPEMLWHIYLDPAAQRGTTFDGQLWGWHEFGNYVGAFGALALLAGLAWAIWYRRADDRWLGLGLAGATLVCFLVSLGRWADWAPASLLSHIPLLSGFRIPSRYTLALPLLATATLAWSLRTAGAGALASRTAKVCIAMVCAIAAAHMISVNRSHLQGTFSDPPYDIAFQWMRSPSTFATDAQTNGAPMLKALVQDRLFINCYEPLQLRRTGTPGSAPVYSDGESHVVIRHFEPNRIEFAVVNGETPSRVYLNTNWSPGWQSNAGPIRLDSGEKPFVMLAAGQSGTFAFWFVPQGLWLGCLVLAVAALVSRAVWRVQV
jgi:hypothetical protein